jgi:hypothetical protein
LFSAKWIPVLNEAVDDFSWLLSRGYSENGVLKLVGDRYRLTKRQRKAVLRAGCSDEARRHRQQHMLGAQAVQGRELAIDAYNLLITVEACLAGGIVLLSRDGCYRDIASVHGTYRKVEETIPALVLIGNALQELGVVQVHWFLDAPVSNSGRLRLLMIELAEKYVFPWRVALVNNPDRVITEEKDLIAVSSDSWVIDHVERWFNLHRYIVERIGTATLINLQGSTAQSGTG